MLQVAAIRGLLFARIVGAILEENDSALHNATVVSQPGHNSDTRRLDQGKLIDLVAEFLFIVSECLIEVPKSIILRASP